MNCPECGNELLIGSDVCTICDLISEEEKQNQKAAKHKKIRLIRILCISIILVLIIGLLTTGFICISKIRIKGIDNGNSENESLLVSYKGTNFYSTIDTLYTNNKKFSKPEIIDAANSSVTDLCISGGTLYYVKDNKLCKYNPKTRKIKPVTKITGDLSIAGYSEKAIYCNIADTLYKFNTKTEDFTKIVDARGIFSDGDLYILSENSLYEYDMKDNSRRQICNIDPYTIPAFIKNGKIICYDYKNGSMFYVDTDSCKINEILKTDDYQNISDITHLNIYDSFIFLRGENGIYRYNKKNGDFVMLSELGYMKYVLVGDNVIYTVSCDNNAYFSDLDGKIIYTVKSDLSAKK